ncbi:hypothetical protein CRV24_007459 [Beauveria bassiana]|nr:hypothetical protein CRV24_007459 [Beauveria bassiana]
MHWRVEFVQKHIRFVSTVMRCVRCSASDRWYRNVIHIIFLSGHWCGDQLRCRKYLRYQLYAGGHVLIFEFIYLSGGCQESTGDGLVRVSLHQSLDLIRFEAKLLSQARKSKHHNLISMPCLGNRKLLFTRYWHALLFTQCIKPQLSVSNVKAVCSGHRDGSERGPRGLYDTLNLFRVFCRVFLFKGASQRLPGFSRDEASHAVCRGLHVLEILKEGVQGRHQAVDSGGAESQPDSISCRLVESTKKAAAVDLCIQCTCFFFTSARCFEL